MIEYEIPFVCLIFTSLIFVIYFSKKKIDLEENFYFRNVLIFSLLVNITNFISHYFASIYLIDSIDSWYTPIFAAINKLGSLFIVIITFNVMCYIFYISFETYRKNVKLYKIVNSIIFFVVGILIFLLDFKVYKVGAITSGEGTAVILTFGIVFLNLITAFIVSLLNIKKYDKRYNSIYIIIPLIFFLGIFVMFNPEFNIYDLILCLLCYLMYHTIENPDIKMLREIQQSKEFSEHANNEKAMFLYNTSQELKMPVKAIEQRCEELLKEQDIKEIINGIKDIKFAVKRLSSTISGTLDMPTTMASNIEIKVSKYSTKLLLKEMESISKLNMKDKNLEFRTSFDDNIPEYLMGDSIRLKQIIATIMNNAIKHTEKGFIEFNVSSVIKHDICRLIITIEDSGAGIESSKLETLFYNAQDEDTVDEEKLTKVNDTRESLSVVKILTNLIGGTVIVNSELGKGSKFTVVLDQQIVEEKTSTDIAIEKLSSNKRILIVDDEEESLKQIAKLLNKYDVNVDAVLWGQDCLEKIRKKQKYDLILLDEDMPRLNGIKTFEKLKLEDNFNIPVVIMIDDKHLEYKERYLYNGFSSCVVKPLKKQELDKIIKKHLKLDE